MSSYEGRPEGLITEAEIDDSPFIIRGTDGGRAAWHVILVPIDKFAALQAQGSGSNFNVTEFGQIIQYRNHQGEIKSLSGWGKGPPQMIETWIDNNYGQ